MNANKLANNFAQTLVASLAFLLASHAIADEAKDAASKRTPWTTSKVKGSPEPPLPFVTEQVFPNLKFNRCIDMCKLPGTNRLLVLEQGGKVYSFENNSDVKKADLAGELKANIEGVSNVYAMVLHPEFEKNRFGYFCLIKGGDRAKGSQIVRFEISDSDPPTINLDTAATILRWQAGGHNGCCLKFGPDGYLYISTGDGAGPNPPDTLQAGQDVSNLLSAILRIDVDQTEGGKNYRIPNDNPFVTLEGARGEIWAYGFRNPWRMSFDSKTGDLWVGDVGWELWEMLDRVERGGNYGWSVMEGRIPANPEFPRGPTTILPPTIDHPHSESSSITDGLTYYGKRLAELHGHHVYSDYDTGKFWSFRHKNGEVVEHREIADTTHRVVGFAEDHSGEFFIVDHIGGSLHQLVPNPRRDEVSQFPRKLSQSGLFASVTDQTPAAGVVPYNVISEQWSDHATAQRFVGVPGDAVLPSGKAIGKTMAFPDDSVLVKTLSLEMEAGNPASQRRIETQILHFNGIDWLGYSYRWNEDQTDAELLDASGAEHVFEIIDKKAPGGRRKQTWRFSGRAECMRCHNKWSGPVLGFNASQLTSDSQLSAFASTGLFSKPLDKKTRFANPRDTAANLNTRARAYLHTNCAHCHRMHAGSAVLSYLHSDLSLEKMNMVGVRPTQGTFGLHSAQVIRAKDPFGSVLYYRMSKLGGGRMPHIGSTEVDRKAVDLIYNWINHISPDDSKDTSGQQFLDKLRQIEATRVDRLRTFKGSSDQLSEQTAEILSTTSGALQLIRAIDRHAVPENVANAAIEHATNHKSLAVRDLFERFLPPEKRVKRLGTVVDADRLLKLKGDVERGRQLFFTTAGIACKNCHRIGKEGKQVGPDLTQIGKKLNRQQLLESILEPSKRIDREYVTYVAQTLEGKLVTGLLVKKTTEAIVLRDAENKETRILADDIDQLSRQKKSLMPELLLRDMTAEQVADLLAFLSSLK
ncbi:MAG: hypothetical protein CMJ78_26275 [Planctomycetaceae bacterium]|nr:hypothetical protein [Planctomycetaceae bacterium]